MRGSPAAGMLTANSDRLLPQIDQDDVRILALPIEDNLFAIRGDVERARVERVREPRELMPRVRPQIEQPEPLRPTRNWTLQVHELRRVEKARRSTALPAAPDVGWETVHRAAVRVHRQQRR